MVTSFLVQASENLEADFIEISAHLLHDIVLIQLAASDIASSLPNITFPSADPSAGFVPDSIDIWVNGLWVVSLTLSLVVALFAVLVKQWLHHYMTLPSGTPGINSHTRQYRFMGLERWRVSVIIGLLPIIMHVSLGLFLSGLVLFYVPLRTSIAWTVGTITGVVCVLYLTSNIIPLFVIQCPYKTPLSDFINYCHQSIAPLESLRFLTRSAAARWHYATSQNRPLPQRRCREHLREESAKSEVVPKSLVQLETEAVHAEYNKLSVDAIDWVFHISSNPSVHSIVIQATGGLPVGCLAHADKVLWTSSSKFPETWVELIRQNTDDGSSSHDPRRCLVGRETALERICRSRVFKSFTSPFDSLFSEANVHSVDEDGIRLHSVALKGRDPNLRMRFISVHQNERLHPLVWGELMKDVEEYLRLLARRRDDITAMDVQFIDALLACSWYFMPAKYQCCADHRQDGLQVVLPLTLREIVNSDPAVESQITDHLLKMFSSFDCTPHPARPFGVRYMVLIAAGRFALQHLSNDLSGSSDATGPSEWWRVSLVGVTWNS